MTTKSIKICYAHCIRFTPGQPDVHPHSAYEWRVVDAILEHIRPSAYWEWDQWRVKIGPNWISNEEDERDAIDSAQYNLMDESRKLAAQNFAAHMNFQKV